jgi:hypothetical protein
MPSEDPYRPPTAALKDSGPPRPNWWWKTFFWITLMLTILFAAAFPFLESLTAFDYVDFLLSVIALVGIFGFSHHKQIGRVVFWRYFFYIALLESIFFSVALPILGIPRYGSSEIDFSIIFEIGYTLLFLWALHSYAYKATLIWQRN